MVSVMTVMTIVVVKVVMTVMNTKYAIIFFTLVDEWY